MKLTAAAVPSLKRDLLSTGVYFSFSAYGIGEKVNLEFPN